MSKKRTSLDSILTRSVEEQEPAPPPAVARPVAETDAGNRPGVKQQTAYLKTPVYEQLRKLAFEERKKMHDYIIEGLDSVFRARGLPSIDDLDKSA